MLIFSVGLSVFAQTTVADSLKIIQLNLQLKDLEEKFASYINQQNLFNEQFKSLQLNLIDSLNGNSQTCKSNRTEIKNLDIRVTELENYKKRINLEVWDKASKNLVYLPTVIKAMNSRINLIHSTLSNQQKNELLLEITNPQSGILGFKMGDKIMELLESEIFTKNSPKTGKKKELDEYKEKTSQILDVVEFVANSPIITAIPGIGSALSMTNMVTGFLRNIAFMNNGVKQQDITNFENAINKYIVFYNSLNDNQIQSTYATSQLEIQLLSHQEAFYSYVETVSQVINFKFSGKQENYPTTSAYYTAFIGEYELYTQNYFAKFKPFDENYNFNPDANRYIALNNDLDKMLNFYTTIEKIQKNYIENEKYNTVRNEKTLELAITSGIATKKYIDAAVKRLQKATETSMQNFTVALNLQGLELDVKRILYKY